MTILRRIILLAALGVAPFVANRPRSCHAAETNDLPHFQELFRLLRANLPEASDEELNRAAVQGLLDHFYPRVLLVTNRAAAAVLGGPLLSQATVYDQSYGYLRVVGVAPGLADQTKLAFNRLDSTNRLKGVVLDLRFADGQDYSTAASLVDRFLTREQPILDWADGAIHSTAKPDAIPVPVAVLVNRQTAGAAEAVAAALRETDAAVLIGSRTAGQAHSFKEFDLSTGQRLRIATGEVKVGKGKVLSASGVTPDIEVAVPGEDEKAYFADAYKALTRRTARPRATNDVAGASSTNRISRRRLNEAELVRMQREGLSPEEAETATRAKGEEDGAEQVVRDPVLARALDLLKGIAIVERGQPR